MLAGLDRLVLGEDFTKGSKYSALGRPASRDGRDDDACPIKVDCDWTDGIRGLGEGRGTWLVSSLV